MLYASLLLLLATTVQYLAASSTPSVTSFLGLPSVTSPYPGVLACGPLGDPDVVVIYYTSSDGNMRYKKATKSGRSRYEWSPTYNMGGLFMPLTPSAIEYEGQAFVVQIATDKTPKYVLYDPRQQSFGTWVALPGSKSQTAPVAEYLSDRKEIVVIVRGLDWGFHYYTGTPEKGFTKPKRLVGQYSQPPESSVIWDSDGKQSLLLVGIASNQYICHMLYKDGKWSALTRSNLRAPEGYESIGLYPSSYDATVNGYRSATLVVSTKNGMTYQTTYDEDTNWKTFVDFGYQVPPKFRMVEYRNGTCIYSKNDKNEIYMSSYGESLCKNRY